MEDSNDKINALSEKLDLLLRKQDLFSSEINKLRIELDQLKNVAVDDILSSEAVSATIDKPTVSENVTENAVILSENITEKVSDNIVDVAEVTSDDVSAKTSEKPNVVNKTSEQSDLERFIGENLINKVGIVITVIGVAIGAKYSIENGLISPLTRIVLGYLMGIGLLGFGIKLKESYENYSSVLVSGAMAIMYFITFSAYSFYGLIPQTLAFVMMSLFTVFTVVAAINYDKQIIAHFGLVGAYAVPFLLSDGSGRVGVLFSYMTMLNAGILVIAFKKYWKSLYYVSFVLTWIIFLSWFVFDYETSKHFRLALVFLVLFFTIFYITFLAYKLVRKEKFANNDIVMLMLNSFVFYGIGYAILSGHQTGNQLLGLFTLTNSIVHFGVGFVIYQQKLADKNILYLAVGMALIFATITFPVQLDGNWVTLFWACEAALLFWIGRSKDIPFYEKLAFPLMVLAFSSLIDDWSNDYDNYIFKNPASRITLLFNINFLTSLLCISAFGVINYLYFQKKVYAGFFSKFKAFLIAFILIFTFYFAFRIEIYTYWNQLYKDSYIQLVQNVDYTNSLWNYDLLNLQTIWILNYSLFFVAMLCFVNLRKLRNYNLGYISNILIIITILVFLTQGLYELSDLRERFYRKIVPQYYAKNGFYLWFRYVSFGFVALSLYAYYQSVKQDFPQKIYKIVFEFVLHTTILWIVSSELINWLDIYKSQQSYKLGLSILWGVYALFLIAYGIWKNNKPLRIGAIILFAVTLVKLFFYDLTNLNTIAKTVVFVSLGVLLLIISFLYNKYKHLIFDTHDDE